VLGVGKRKRSSNARAVQAEGRKDEEIPEEGHGGGWRGKKGKKLIERELASAFRKSTARRAAGRGETKKVGA